MAQASTAKPFHFSLSYDFQGSSQPLTSFSSVSSDWSFITSPFWLDFPTLSSSFYILCLAPNCLCVNVFPCTTEHYGHTSLQLVHFCGNTTTFLFAFSFYKGKVDLPGFGYFLQQFFLSFSILGEKEQTFLMSLTLF